MGNKRPVVDIVADRIIEDVRHKHKIISAPSVGALIDELSNALTRVKRGRRSAAELILDGIDQAVAHGKLERFDDEFGVILALPNEWPPSGLLAFPVITEEDFAPPFDMNMFRHIHDKNALAEILTY